MAEAKDSLGDRMKRNYEDRFRAYLPRRIPAIIRLDGRAFHSFTRGLDRPFDARLSDAMIGAAMCVAEDAQGFRAAYLQSDEVSILLSDTERLSTEGWFDFNKSKMESIAASCMTAHFNRLFGSGTAMFDARAFSVPREEVSNYFLWRVKDWERNSVSMYCREFYSAREMLGQGKADQHEMLHAKGKNWATDFDERWRNGTWLVRTEAGIDRRTNITAKFAEVDAVIDPLLTIGAEQ